MKNLEVLELNHKLVSTNFDSIKSGKFQYNLQKNIDILEKEVKSLNKVIESLKTDKYSELLKEGQEWAQVNPKLDQKEWNNFIYFEEELKDYNKAIEEFLNSDNEGNIKFFDIHSELIISLELNQAQMKAIFKFVVE